MTKTTWILFVLGLALVSSCDPEDSEMSGQGLYRLKGDYFDLIPVRMDETKSKVLAFGDSSFCPYKGNCFIYKVENGYIFDCHKTLNINTAILDIYKYQYSDSMFFDSYINKHILDKDPFIEYWILKQKYFRDSMLFSSCYDTATVNWVIQNNLIEHFFERVK